MTEATAALLKEHNELATIALDDWTGSHKSLEERVKRLRKKATSKTGAKPEAEAPRVTIGSVILAQLEGGNTDIEDILSKVRKQFPNAGTNANSVRWYASQNKISLRAEKAEKPAKGKAAAKKAPAKKAAAKKAAKRASKSK
jgi:alanyl-tRNA synthetase